jgi:DNA-dependent RNA polymerase
VPEGRDAKLLQVLCRQARKDRFIYLVVAERSLILSEAKAAQPEEDVHDLGSSSKPEHIIVRGRRRGLLGVEFGRTARDRQLLQGKTRQRPRVAEGFLLPLVRSRRRDAAHLLLTVNAAVREDIKSIATVHDSFGCLASKAERFRKIIREQFVKMYEEHDVLAEVLEQARKDLGENAKGLPAKPLDRGLLDIKEVLGADYAFG